VTITQAHGPERTVLDWRVLSQGSPRKSGGGKDDPDCDDIGRRHNRKPPSASAQGDRSAVLRRSLPALPTKLSCCLQAVLRLDEPHRLSAIGLKAGALICWEAMWLLTPSRAR
jgi:hypothetical protein